MFRRKVIIGLAITSIKFMWFIGCRDLIAASLHLEFVDHNKYGCYVSSWMENAYKCIKTKAFITIAGT